MICRSRNLLVGFLLLVGIAGLSVVSVESVAAQQTNHDVDINITADRAVAINENNSLVYTIESGDIVTYDITTGKQINSFSGPDGTDRGLAYGNGSLWYADAATGPFDGKIVELDPETGDVRSNINTGYDPYGLGFGDGSLWAGEVTGVPNNVYEFDSSGNQVGSFDISGGTSDDGPNGIAYYNGSVWVGGGGELVAHSTNGNKQETIDKNGISYSGLVGTDNALYGPDADGNLTVIRGETDFDSPATATLNSSDNTTFNGSNTTVGFELKNTGSNEAAHVLDLTLPSGWTVQRTSNDSAEWKASEKQWLWQTLSPDQTVTPSITLGIPSNTTGTHRIEGTVYTTKDGTQQAVANTTATVTVENRSVILSPADLSVPNGTTSQLVVNATQDDGTLETVTNSAEYTVGDQSIATVNATGLVTAKQTGTTTLTASYGGASNTTTLTVTDAVPESLTTTVGNQTLTNGSETALTATVQLTNGTTAEVTTATSYSSNDSSVITVDEQNATLAAESTGTTSVVAVYEVNETSVRDTVSLTVDPATLEEAIDTNNDGQIDDIEILTAIDYWQTDAKVPYTEGERIDALEILDLIYKWRYNITID